MHDNIESELFEVNKFNADRQTIHIFAEPRVTSYVATVYLPQDVGMFHSTRGDNAINITESFEAHHIYRTTTVCEKELKKRKIVVLKRVENENGD